MSTRDVLEGHAGRTSSSTRLSDLSQPYGGSNPYNPDRQTASLDFQNAKLPDCQMFRKTDF
eukprot:scaffold601_cov170-Ochromonas_danica.AAC.39